MKINSLNAANNLVQVIYQNVTTPITLSGATSFNDTIPQITDGTQIITATITPKNINNLLLIKFATVLSLPATYAFPPTLALFQDAIVNSLSATNTNQIWSNSVWLTYTMTAGTISATTFQVRGGPASGGGPVYINSDHLGVRLFGGSSNTSLVIFEYSV